MAEEEEVPLIVNRNPTQSPSRPPSFVEVTCTSSGKVRRFAAGTEAKFAVSLINRKLGHEKPLAFHIEAVKQGEESISFGPNALLVDYSDDWKLQTVIEFEGHKKAETFRATDLNESKSVKNASQSDSSFQYFGRIFLAIFLIFFLGAIFTIALENLPRLILLINSSM